MMEYLFWISFFAVFYTYFGYPLVLILLGKFHSRKIASDDMHFTPGISVLVPVHNESQVIQQKIDNTLQLRYPFEQLQVLFISDGSTDGTNELVKAREDGVIQLLEVTERKGKANALNVGLEHARFDIIVFSDASILLDENALLNIVNPFQDPEIGCVSGEDHIKDTGGEGAYGRYELWLRNLESRIHSLVGASGSFYAQRKHLCERFGEGLAPDFLSVLNTVEKGFRAVSEPRAFGYMSSVKSTSDEFNRKIRTLIRGMSALSHKKNLLNVFRYGVFSFVLFSHKLMRWLVPFFLILLLLSNILILSQGFYQFTIALQAVFYLTAFIAFRNLLGIGDRLIGKIALYFTMVNIGILVAWMRFLYGTRQEIWNPSVRS